jgi:type VI secretion system protein ImpA
MTLPEKILSRIPGENPSGENLRWEAIYERVKEARREEEDLPQGEWAYKVKAADPGLVIRLTSEAISTKTKDLQLAAWLTEALVLQDGVRGLQEGLDLLQGMIENFWDTLYPELENEDLELRAAPLNWIGSSLADQIRKVPLTRSRFNWFKYTESRSVGYEEACAGNESRMKARESAIAEKKLTPEAFDQDAEVTPREFYVDLAKDLNGVLPALQALNDLCKEKFKGESPSFGKLRSALEDMQSLVGTFLKSKEELVPEVTQPAVDLPPMTTVAAPAPDRIAEYSNEPVDREDAIQRIMVSVNRFRRLDPSCPVPYLILRGLWWGELLTLGTSMAAAELEPPASEMRQRLKRHAKNGDWRDLLEGSETALASPCGMAWLDLQRYSTTACQELGSDYDPVVRAIRSSVSALIVDFPDLPQSTFLDGTAVASPETLTWLEKTVNSSHAASEEAIASTSPRDLPHTGGEEKTRDTQELAMRAVRSGRIQEAMEILTREIAQERSGRKRFERKAQLAQVCLTAGQESIAYPILKDLAQEIECRKLAEWESPAVLTNPLTLLFRCMNKMGSDVKEKQEIYERICRLDPIQALACLK